MAFVKGERVLSFHDELLYEAKILTVKEKKNETRKFFFSEREFSIVFEN